MLEHRLASSEDHAFFVLSSGASRSDEMSGHDRGSCIGSLGGQDSQSYGRFMKAALIDPREQTGMDLSEGIKAWPAWAQEFRR